MYQVASAKEKSCTFYIHSKETEPHSTQNIQKIFETGRMEEKIEALKTLIISLVNDEGQSSLLMHVINYVLPKQGESHNLKKILFYYWEIVEKMNANGEIKDEVILVCNSLRNDLLSPNEYIRGRTMKMLARIPFRGIIEPLYPSIVENLNHKMPYVRKNALALLTTLYNIYGDDIVSDMDAAVMKIFYSESDLSLKRAAFLFLLNVDSENALKIVMETFEEIENGEILQLSVIESLKLISKNDSRKKSQLMRIIVKLSQSKSSSVLYECANTLISISNSQKALKLASTILIQLLNSNNDNNIKLMILSKLSKLKSISPKLIEDQISEITDSMKSDSNEIKMQIIDLIRECCSKKTAEVIIDILLTQISHFAKTKNDENDDFLIKLLENMNFLVHKFGFSHDNANEVFNNLMQIFHISEPSAILISSIVKKIFSSHPNLQSNLLSKLLLEIPEIKCSNIVKVIFVIFSEVKEKEQCEQIITKFLPFFKEIEKINTDSQSIEQKNVLDDEKKIKFKTVVLPDGTYGSQMVTEGEQKDEIDENLSQFLTFFKESPNLVSLLVTTLMRLFYFSQNTQILVENRADVLLLFCELGRFYSSKINVDNEILEKLQLGIKLVMNPEELMGQFHSWLEIKTPEATKEEAEVKEKDDGWNREREPAKQFDNFLNFRQLKGRANIYNEIDIGDDDFDVENPMQVQKDDDYCKNLLKIVQMTGYSDPIYAESVVTVHKYEITFETYLLNRTDKRLQNVSLEFCFQDGENKLAEKPQQFFLLPNGSTVIKNELKLNSANVGTIFASITFENSAGITQAHLITKEITIDLFDFVYPDDISEEKFRQLWKKYDWENRIMVSTHSTMNEYISLLQKNLKMKLISSLEKNNGRIGTFNLHARTKIDDDFLVSISLEEESGLTNGYIRIRAEKKGIVVNFGEKIKSIETSELKA